MTMATRLTNSALDKAFADIADLGTDCTVFDQAKFTWDRLLPLQAQQYNAGAYREPNRSYRYGPHERHQLDVYLPVGSASISKHPVIVYTYGGGFMFGSKQQFPGVYQNIGTFFSDQGFVVILFDYRLLEHGAKFPSGAEDWDAVMKWIKKGDVAEADLNNIFLFGESAGGVHMLHWLWTDYYTQFKPIAESVGMHIRGAALVDIGYDTATSPEQVAPPDMAYYGSYEAAKKYSACSLAQINPATCPILALHAPYDPKDMQATREAFKVKTSDFIRRTIEFHSCAGGHNHISLPLSIGIGRDEWAYDAAQWAKVKTKWNDDASC